MLWCAFHRVPLSNFDPLILPLTVSFMSRLCGAQGGQNGAEITAKALGGAWMVTALLGAPFLPAIEQHLTHNGVAGLEDTTVADESADWTTQVIQLVDSVLG